MIIKNLSSWFTDANPESWRIPPRPAELRQANYQQRFDYRTIIYDCFWDSAAQDIIICAPPAFNLHHLLSAENIHSDADISSYRCDVIDRTVEIYLRCAQRPASVLFGRHGSESAVIVGDDLNPYFAERKVLTTLQKDNELTWIKDWIEFYNRKHSIDGIIIYDNGSSRYDLDELHDAAAQVSGIKALCVVNWPFPYGPGAYRTSSWDSNFCQQGAFSHARRRLLRDAHIVVNADIDELAIVDGGQTLVSLAEESNGLLLYNGVWIENVGATMSDSLSDERRHKDFHYALRQDIGVSPPKWTVDLLKLPHNVQLGTHGVFPFRHDVELSKRVTYRHFRCINTSWNAQRSRPAVFNASQHQFDHEIYNACRAVFSDADSNDHRPIYSAGDIPSSIHFPSAAV